jgi:transcriptional regulator with PAS, ATPase and Fis domain
LLHDDQVLRATHLPGELVAAALAGGPVTISSSDGTPVIPTLEDVELAHIRRVLEVCRGNRTLAAQQLGITRQTLTKRIGASDDRE